MAELPDRPATEAARNNTIDLLSEHFAQDHLSLDDFERRVSVAHRAKTMNGLTELLRGLPTGNVPATLEDDPGTQLTQRVEASVPAGRVKEHDRAIAVLGETSRKGRWIPARSNQVIAVLGSAVLDLREALLGPGETVFKCITFMGSIEVIAREGTYVECSGSAVLGSFEQHHNSPTSMTPDAPVVRIEGISVLGSVEVEFRELGESKRDTKRRRRRERRERRRLGPGRR